MNSAMLKMLGIDVDPDELKQMGEEFVDGVKKSLKQLNDNQEIAVQQNATIIKQNIAILEALGVKANGQEAQQEQSGNAVSGADEKQETPEAAFRKAPDSA